jgi:hypothetical protein
MKETQWVKKENKKILDYVFALMASDVMYH